MKLDEINANRMSVSTPSGEIAYVDFGAGDGKVAGSNPAALTEKSPR